ATKRRRSSITEHSLHGINTSRQKPKSVTHVSGTNRHLSLRSLILPTFPLAEASTLKSPQAAEFASLFGTKSVVERISSQFGRFRPTARGVGI
ncbi:hypothetical protein RFN29_34295, partial [Mesorhizobium sp. VK22B]